MSKPVKFLAWIEFITLILIGSFFVVKPASAKMVMTSIGESFNSMVRLAPAQNAGLNEVSFQQVATYTPTVEPLVGEGASSATVSATAVPGAEFKIKKGNTQCPLPPAEHGMGYYPIEKGDSWKSVSEKFRVPVSTILELNPDTPFTPGQILVLPAAEGPWDNAKVCPETVTYLKDYTFGNKRRACPLGDAPEGYGWYKIIKGETPQSIAAKFNVPLDTVLLLNEGYSFNRGSILLLPAAEGPWNNEILCP
jgi:LysM repeat protein